MLSKGFPFISLVTSTSCGRQARVLVANRKKRFSKKVSQKELSTRYLLNLQLVENFL